MTSWLFKESIAYRPFHYPWANDLWKEHERMVWIEDEIPLTDDVTAWQNGTMSEDEKDFVTQILRMFTQSDVNVGQNYHHNIIPHIRNNEVVKMLGGFANREGTHQNAYALLVDTLGLPESEHTAFLEIAEMAEKNDFMLECDSSTIRGLAQTIAKSTFNEGVSLFASFAMLLNFQRFGKMLGMAKIVEWSLKDESLTLDTEVLTENGWKTIDQINAGDKILEWNMETQESSFQPVQKVVDVTRNETYVYEGNKLHQHVSGGHRMIIESDGKVTESTGEDLDVKDDFNFILAGKKKGNDLVSEDTKQKIDATKKGEHDLTWVYDLLPTMSSEWANSFLEYYGSNE